MLWEVASWEGDGDADRPTKTTLAIYYTVADVVLLAQCFFYRGFTLSDSPRPKPSPSANHHDPTEHSPLLDSTPNGHASPSQAQPSNPFEPAQSSRRSSLSLVRSHLASPDAAHLSPATPLHNSAASPAGASKPSRPSLLTAALFNSSAVLVVCAAGGAAWYVADRAAGSGNDPSPPTADAEPHFSPLGQVFGYICAVLYLASRVPQLLLNHGRKSVEGLSMLFFLFACVGNATYVASILLYEPLCRRHHVMGGGQVGAAGERGDCAPGEAQRLYWRYVAVNFSWLLGSFGTLLLDGAVFVQWWIYREGEAEGGGDAGARGEDGG